MTALEIVILILVAGYVASALDDLVFDVTYWGRALLGRWDRPVVTLAELEAVPQRPAAIVTAAWGEEAVVGKMALYNASAIDYDAYDHVIGTYPNDAATQAEVDRVAGIVPHVRKVVTPQPGPTSKADCLNAVLAALEAREQETGARYAFVLMHDPEDIIHPLELKLANWAFATERVDMLQLPVFSVRVPAHRLTAGTYMDEFAEFYTKDMFVREHLTGFVPSAGVGTAIRRDVLERLAEELNGRAFAINSLTEDYDVGLELALGGYTSRVLAQRVLVPHRVREHGVEREIETEELVATYAPFPTTFRASVRQRTRWTIGIVFQAWQNWRWPGRRRLRWLLAHDRKAPLAFGIVAAGYLLLLWVLVQAVLRYTLLPALPGTIPASPWLRAVFLVGLVLMGNRLLQRAIATTRMYGIGHGLLAILRQPWGNLIYIVVVVRAARQFFGARRRGAQVTWEKTRNYVPEYVANRVRFGEHLIAGGLLSPQQLLLGLREQSRSSRLLGEILVDQRILSRAQLDRALADFLPRIGRPGTGNGQGA